MSKLILGVIAIVAIVFGGFFFLNNYIYQEKQAPKDYKEATYLIQGEPVTIGENGVRYFGNEAKGDLNGDMVPDLAFLITQETGGSGTFYYLVGAIQNEDNTYQGTHAVFLGDRIAPQTIQYESFSGIPGGYLIVNYAERLPSEPMTTQPSLGKSIWLKLDPATMQFGEIVQDFEGEADPSKMKLGMKKWNWVSTQYEDGRQLFPRDPSAFTLSFDEKAKTVSIGTDCNSGGGSYTVKGLPAQAGETLSFGPIASTLMFCAESQETEFFQFLENTSGFHFTSRGELILHLKSDSGTVTFR